MALDPTQNPDGIGHTLDGRQMTDAQRLQVLLAQLNDPERDPGSTPELQREIARMQKTAGTSGGGPRFVQFEGKVHQFPADATDEEVSAALEQLYPTPQAPRASQADVRRTEPKLSPAQTQEERVAAFDKAMKDYVLATGGAIPPGKNINQAVEEWSGVQDPAKTATQAQQDELRAGGDLKYGDSVPYVASKALAAIGGFAVGGPAGATASESAVRFTALAFNLKKAVDAGAIDEDRAAEIMAKEMANGAGEDALFNFGVPLLGQIVKRIPGMSWLAEKTTNALRSRFGLKPVSGDPELAAQRSRKLDQLGQQAEKAAETPQQGAAARQAVQEIGKRTENIVPTPGQVTGEASRSEGIARKGTPQVFGEQQKELEKTVGGMREELMNPQGVQPTRPQIGETVLKAADDLQAAVKQRLRPTFEAADSLGVKVDLSDVLAKAKDALAKDAKVPGGRLDPRERAGLEDLVRQLEGTPGPGAGNANIPGMGTPNTLVSPEAALDFISRQKEKLRAVTADYKPSKYYDTVVNQLTTTADTAYARAAASAGKGDVVRDLLKAQDEYRGMMSTVYEDAVKQALKKNPEDVGRLFWQPGNVSEIEQLQKMLRMAVKEGTMREGERRTLHRAMISGFLQEGVPTVEAAAKWSDTLKANPKIRDTWNTLTAAPGGSQLRGAMEVLEQAAKMAGRNSSELLKDQVIPIAVQRSAAGGMGQSYVTGAIRPGMVVTGISITGLTRMMATAYTQGNKGVLNATMRALRANGAGTAVAAKALQESLAEIEKFAAANGVEDVFVGQSPSQ